MTPTDPDTNQAEKPQEMRIGNTLYRPVLSAGVWVLKDEFFEPPPGDPNGDWRLRSTLLAKGHQQQHLDGWQYTRTSGLTDEGFDPDATPSGDGWEVNPYCGAGGHESDRDGKGRARLATYWRRRVGRPY